MNFATDLFQGKHLAAVSYESFAADAKAGAEAEAVSTAQRQKDLVVEDPSLITPKKRGPPAGPPAGGPKGARVPAPDSGATGSDGQ